MRLKKSLVISAIVTASILSLGACASGNTPAGEPSVAETPEFEAGTTMAKLHDAGAIASELNSEKLAGVRFDSTSRTVAEGQKWGGQTIPTSRCSA